MKIAIIGAGFTGLTAAYELSKAGHQVTVFEKEAFAGGLSSGIRKFFDDYPKNWWDLEKSQHHWFANDFEVFKLINELNLTDKLIKLSPKTSILYQDKVYRFDTALAVLKFPAFSIFEKLRLGAAISYLKFEKNWKVLEKETADSWWKKVIGNRVYKILWEPLLKGKFENYYKDVNMTWFWARIKKRTQKLYYFEGGFQVLIEALEKAIKDHGGTVRFKQNVKEIDVQQTISLEIIGGLQEGPFDKIILTTPPTELIRLIPNFPSNYKSHIHKLKGISAQILILFLKKPLLMDGSYWLNINDFEYPFVFLIEHTNFINPSHYGNTHIVYIGNYLKKDRPLMQMSKEEALKIYFPYLKKINPTFTKNWILKSLLFHEGFAQPIAKINHSQNIPSLQTPFKNVYFASMFQVYPWDRGTNYAIEMGKEVAEKITNF